MMKKILIFAVILIVNQFYAQGDLKTYPKNYFSNPLDIPLVLSGTFGELRNNHFHSGIDLKTKQREGLNVYSIAQGYVSRIKVSHWGFGKAIYVLHPNGYTSVYGHLQKFSPEIEAYVKKHQYEKKSYEIELFPKAGELKVNKNEIIAFSGNTGGSGGPHLHFEIRDALTQKPINPFLFGIEVADSKQPKFNTLIAYTFTEDAHVNQMQIPSQISIKQLQNGDLLADKINAYGKIGFGVNVFDQLDGAFNKNGVYSLELFLNGDKKYDFKTTSFAFSESKLINLTIDYERYKKMRQRIVKCFVEPNNTISLLENSNDGFITVEDGNNYTAEIVVKDFKGNSQKLTIPILGKKMPIKVKYPAPLKTDYWMDKNVFNKFNIENATVAFPKQTFYNNFYLDLKTDNKAILIHEETVPVNKNFTLTFDVSAYTPAERDKLYIAHYNSRNRPYYVKTVKKPTYFYTSTKKLGKYKLLSDDVSPKILLSNFKNKQWISNHKSIQIKINDFESGIRSYAGEINGEWVLFEYEPKSNLLTYNLSDKHFNEAAHNLKLVVTDNVGNSTTLEATFFRKP